MWNSLDEEIPELVQMEMEALKAIYLEDITIKTNDLKSCYFASIIVDVFPKTGNKIEDQFVRLKLSISVSKNYPKECPLFEFESVRGLTDDRIEEIRSEINSIFEKKFGETLIYDMIEKSRDVLTALNFPVGNRCALCLYELTTRDQVLRSECFHHLHSRCFADYVVSKQLEFTQNCVTNDTKLQIHCPVCRIELNSIDWRKYRDPNQYSEPYLSNEPLNDELILIEEAKLHQKKFETIYEKQLKNGGIIQNEYQRKKCILRISETNPQTIDS